MFGRIVGAIVGAVMSFASAFSLWKLIELILSGAVAGNWIAVIAGGILVWIFGGLLILGLFAGGIVIILSIFD